MIKLLTAVLAAGVFFAPVAHAQEAAPTDATTAAPQPTDAAPKAGEGAAPGAAPDSGTGQGVPAPAEEAAGEHATPDYPLKEPEELDWTFAGMGGHWDIGQLQRGLKVYKEVCASCHSLSYVAFRNLSDPGGPAFSVAQAAAFAAEYQVKDGPNDAGDMFERPGRPADYFPSPFPNEQAARASNGGAYPPDLSLITKARSYPRGFPMFIVDLFTQFQEQGPNYVDALMQGYQEPPAGFALPEGSSYNKYFPGHAIKMPNPLSDGQVTYDDGSPATVAQYAKDVTTFLMWTAEPHMESRKRLGMQVFVFLILLTGLLYFTKKKIWADAH
jgi:ubiquinol-cytochrome c reductase cytochrome b/c1 subunit